MRYFYFFAIVCEIYQKFLFTTIFFQCILQLDFQYTVSAFLWTIFVF